MPAIAIIGIRITARTQIGMAVIEFTILIGFAIAGLVAVLGHHSGTVHITSGWFSLQRNRRARQRLGGVPGRGVHVHRLGRHPLRQRGGQAPAGQPGPGRDAGGRAARRRLHARPVGLQGVVSPAKLQANSASSLVYMAQSLGGSGWAKVMALSLALSVIATTGTGIVLTARIVYGMASYRVLPEFLANVSRRFSTPVAASIIVGLLIIALSWVYLLTTSVQNAFNDVVAVTGLLFAIFYILTAVATIVFYRRRVITGVRDALLLGILPLGAAGFLGWVIVKSLGSAPAAEIWSVVGVVGAGVVLMLVARFVLQSPFFHIERESSEA